MKAASRTFGSVEITGRIEGEVVKALGKAGLKFLSHNGTLRARIIGRMGYTGEEKNGDGVYRLEDRSCLLGGDSILI